MRLLIAAGGTGGHIFPGIAVARAAQTIDATTQVFFVGTERGFEKDLVPKAGFEVHMIKVSPLKGKSIINKIIALWQIPGAIIQSIKLIRKLKIDTVLGIGGYASGPVMLAAWLLRIPCAICEPNSIPGFTNRFLGKLRKHVFGAFHYTDKFFPYNFHLVGTPLRSEFTQTVWQRQHQTHSPFHMFVVGGSLGAQALNLQVPQALLLLKKMGLDIHVTHQTGARDVESVRHAYQGADIKAEVAVFFDDMPHQYANADIVVCRAGAMTCAEITAVGTPTIFVPFPHAADNHQVFNAGELVQANAALMIEQSEMTAERLCQLIHRLLKDHDKRLQLSHNAQKLAHQDAARVIASAALNRFVHGQ